MLDTAEFVLHALADQLALNGWSVNDVFGQPGEVVQLVEY